jgi:4-amino-4-deoxy-L-arabinose transferase-like glycosyltransferase
MKRKKQCKHRPERHEDHRLPIRRKIVDRIRAMTEWRFTPLCLAVGYFLLAAPLGVVFHKIPAFDSESDFFWEYLPLAKDYLHGRLTIGQFRGPAYPTLLAGLGWLTGDFVRAGILISALSGAAVVGLTFALLRRLEPGMPALAATSLTAANAVFFMYSYKVGTDMFFVALGMACLYWLLRGDLLHWLDLILAGVFGGIAYLTRYNGIFLLVMVPLLVWINPWRLDIRRRWLSGLVFLAVFFAVIAPWGLHCLQQTGRFFYSLNYRNVALEVYENGKWADSDAIRYRWIHDGGNVDSLWEVIRSRPAGFLFRVASNLWDHVRLNLVQLTGWLVGILAGLGVIAGFMDRPGPRTRLLLLGGGTYLAVLGLIHYEVRYSLFLVPWYGLLAGLALAEKSGPFGHAGWRKIAPWLLMAAVAASLAGAWMANRAAIAGGPEEIVAIADWFRLHIPSEQRGRVVAARKPHIAYYMGLEFKEIPLGEDLDGFLRALRRCRVNYLYFGGAEAYTRPGLARLLDPSLQNPHLKMLAYSVDPLSVLWEVK